MEVRIIKGKRGYQVTKQSDTRVAPVRDDLYGFTTISDLRDNLSEIFEVNSGKKAERKTEDTASQDEDKGVVKTLSREKKC